MSALGLPKTQHVQQGINVQLQLLPLPGQVREGQTGLGHSQLQSRADDLQPDSKWEEKKIKKNYFLLKVAFCSFHRK